MNEKQFQHMVDKLEKEMMRTNQRRTQKRFEGVALLQPQPADTPEVKALIGRHNQQARSYNRLGGEMGRIIQQAIDRNVQQTRPQDDLLGVIDELLRLRLASHQSLLHDVEPQLHSLEMRMKATLHGPTGLKDLAAKISHLRGA